MICPQCHGKGHLEFQGGEVEQRWNAITPCPYCNGLGQTSCCEGSERGGQLSDEKDKPDEA